MTSRPAADPAPARRRARNTLVAGVALGSTGHIAAVTVGTIVANELLGSQALAGAPAATVVLGAAIGAVVLSALMARTNRRTGLTSGYLIGAAGALVAAAAVISRSFPLLLAGTVLIGFGNSANQLSRYAAADMVPAARRASAIGIVVWGATVGSVIGPTLVPISGELAQRAGLPLLVGPYLVPVLFVGLAALLSFALLRPDPYELADESSRLDAVDPGRTIGPLRAILARPGVAAAIVALVFGLFTGWGGAASAYAAIAVGGLVWACGKFAFGLQAPYVCGVLAALFAYVLVTVAARLLAAPRRAQA
jgi:MFS family permease